MIDLKGKTFDEAQDALNSIGLGITRGGEESSDVYAQGQIVSQSTEVGVMVDKNTTISVVISSGVGEFDVPSVVGLDKGAAEARLKEYGLAASFDYAYNDSVPNDNVISQSPEAGQKAKKGDTVSVLLSQGRELAQMINVIGLSEADARTELDARGIIVSSVSSDYSDTIPENHVIDQSVPEGKYIEKGQSVTLVISLGQKITTTYYSLNNYIIEKLESIPDYATQITAKITLYKSEGNDVINTWTANAFPYAINQGGIENCSEGYFTIEWEWKYLDDEDVEYIETEKSEIEGVTFTPE